MDFRLDKIVFENYKGYKDKQLFDFTTHKQYQKDPTTVRKKWNTYNTKKYKKILGIWGKNSSGKTSVLEIVSLWRRYFFLINDNAHPGRYEGRNYYHYLAWKYERTNILSEKNFEDFNYFHDPKKPLIISFYFSSSKFSFEHQIIEKSYKLHTNEKELVEKVNIIDNMTNVKREVWDSNKQDSSLHEQVHLFWLLDEMFAKKNKTMGQNISVFDIFKTLKKIVVPGGEEKLISSYKKNRCTYETIWKIVLNFARNLEIFDADVPTSSLKPVFVSPSKFNHGIDSINESVNQILRDGKIKINKIENVLLTLIKLVDSNIKDVGLSFNNKKKTLKFRSITTKTDNENFPEELSSGTISFVDLMLKIWKNKLLEKSSNSINYVFVDELGLNWHTNLTKEFLFKISEGIMGNNMVLVFSSHDASIADSLSKDSIYVINNESQLIRVSDIPNKKGNLPRKKEKFSSNYLNDVLDLYSTNPDLYRFYELRDLLNNE